MTLQQPKPLLPVLGEPILWHTLKRLEAAGCERVAINLYHHGEQIARRFGERFEEMEIHYSRERELQGTLGALAPLRDFLLGAELVVVVNGDSLCRWPIKKMVRGFQRSTASATLLVSTRAPVKAYGGGVGLDREGRIVSFAPGEAHGEVEKRRVFAGLHIFRPQLIENLQPGPADFIGQLYRPLLERGETLTAIETTRPWFDLGTPASYRRGVCEWAQRRGVGKVGGRSWAAPDARIDDDARLRRAVVESGARVQAGAEVDASVVLSGAEVGAGCRLRRALIGPLVDLPEGTVVKNRMVTKARADSPPRSGDSVVGGLVYSRI